MPVLKKHNAEQLARDAVVLDLADIARQGEAIKQAARDQASRIVADAQAERERLISDAREVGLREGEAEGRAQGLERGHAEGETAARAEHVAQLRELQAAWAAALGEFLAQRDHLLVECKRDVLRLAICIAERVTHRAIACDEQTVCRQIEAALGLVGSPTRVRIAVHPDDLELAREVLPDLASRIDNVQHAELVADDTLDRGSCSLRTASGGSIDASVATQLSRIAEMIIPGDAEAQATLPARASRGTEPDRKSDESDSASDERERGDLAA